MMLRKKTSRFFVISCVAVMLVVLILAYIMRRPALKGDSGSIFSNNENQKVSLPQELNDDVLIDTADGVKKVDVTTGKIQSASDFESDDYSNFIGFPKLNDDNQQSFVLASRDKSKAIVSVTTYDSATDPNSSDENRNVLKRNDFICDIQKKKCEPTDILLIGYRGLNVNLQKSDSALQWSAWDSVKNIIMGHAVSADGRDVAPAYVCDTQKKICEVVAGSDSSDQQQSSLIVPSGSFSPSLEKFVIIKQNDEPNIRTGATWSLLLYSRSDTSKPLRSYDISVAIERSDIVAYDSVYSVAWSGDEKNIAIGTSRRIFMFNVESGSLSLVYLAPTNEDGDSYWDSDALFLSGDGKYVVFTDSSATPVDDTTDESFGLLRKIDLSDGNKVSDLLSSGGLGLKL